MKACLWGSSGVRFLLVNFPYAYSTAIQHDLNITPSTLSLMLTLPTLLSIPMLVCAPVLIDVLGLRRTHLGMVLMELLGMTLFAFGFYGQQVPIVLLGSCLMVPAMNTINICQKVVLNNVIDTATFAAMHGTVRVFKSLGAMAANYLLPLYAIQETLPFLVGSAVLDVVLNTCMSRSAGQIPEEPARGVCATLEKKMSPKALRAMPWKYWLIAAAAALYSAVNGQVQFSPYALQKRGGLSQRSANLIMGMVPTCALLLAPACSGLFAKHESLRGPLFIAAAAMHCLGHSLSVYALSFKHWLVDVEAASWILMGISQGILNCGAFGLLAETIKGRREMMATASSMQFILGYALNSAVVQLSFALFDQYFFEWRVLNFVVSAALVADAVAITIFSPLAPDQDDTEDEDDGSTSSSDSKDS